MLYIYKYTVPNLGNTIFQDHWGCPGKRANTVRTVSKAKGNKDLCQVERRWMIKLVLRLAQEDGPLRRECIDHTQQGKHKPEFPIGDSESGTPLSASRLQNPM